MRKLKYFKNPEDFTYLTEKEEKCSVCNTKTVCFDENIAYRAIDRIKI